ncbi:MAG: hypothetical protein ACFCU7_06540 [Pleurocapsa sp.]
MSDWQEQWWKQIENTAADMEGFLTELGEATESLVEEINDSVISLMEQLQTGVVGEVDDLIHDFVDVIITTSDTIDAALSEEWEHFADDDFTSISYHTPSIESHPACINCNNYHGQVYNGNLLVCAMHPNGYEDKSCPDWEQEK